jgi:hypothetical protein
VRGLDVGFGRLAEAMIGVSGAEYAGVALLEELLAGDLAGRARDAAAGARAEVSRAGRHRPRRGLREP